MPLDFSKAAFHQLLHKAWLRAKQEPALNDHHLKDIVAFLQHDLNHELAGNIEAYYLWFKDKFISPDALAHWVQLLRDKISLASIPDKEVNAILMDLSASFRSRLGHQEHAQLLLHTYQSLSTAIHERLPSFPKANQRYQAAIALLEGLSNLSPSHDAASLIAQTYSLLSPGHRGLAVPLFAQCLSCWLRQLSRNAAFPQESAEGPQTPLLHLLNHLDPRQAGNIIINATDRFMTDHVIHHTRRKAAIPYWLYLLRRCNTLQSHPWNSSIWANVYKSLSRSLEPADIDAHLLALGPIDAARVVLHYWLSPRILDHVEQPRIKALYNPPGIPETLSVSYTVSHSSSRSVSKDSRVALACVHMTLSDQQSAASRAPVSPEQDADSNLPDQDSSLGNAERSDVVKNIQADFEARLAAYVQASTPTIAPFADLITAMHQKKQKYDHALEQIMQLLLRHESPNRVFTLTLTLLRRSIYIPPGIALPLIQFFIDTANPGYALRVFQACGNVWPSLCPNLIFSLVENGPVSTITLFDILNRSEYSNSLPLALRSEHETNNLSEQRIQLIHQMAYALATSPHLTPRQAFRRVYDCLRYLHDRKAPLSSLASRALVQAGVIRPLQDGKWVSTVKFEWILQFVNRYEDEHVATMLDKMVYEWRSNNARSEEITEKLAHMYKQQDTVAFYYRRRLGHDSHRWKRRTGQWKPWLADTIAKQASAHETSVPQPGLTVWRPRDSIEGNG